MKRDQLLFSGIWTALVSPFKQNDEIDYPAFSRLLEKQVQGGVRGVVVCGTTGESPTLSEQEKVDLLKFARKSLPSEIRVMGGSGTNSTKASVELSKKMAAEGADSFLVVTPPYNKPSLGGLIKHFEAISKACPQTPICAYHVPGRTGQRLAAAEITALLKSTVWSH